MSHNESSAGTSRSRRLVGVGIALIFVAVAVVAFLLGLGFFQPQEAAPPTVVAMAPVLMPTAAAPTSTYTPSAIATLAPTATSTVTPPPTPSPTPELGTSNVYVEYILDASGSMTEKLPGGALKLTVAKELLIENLAAFRPETNVGLRAYGHRVHYQQRAKSCEDIELIAPVEKGQIEAIATWLGDFKAQGMTPLAESIRLAMDDFVFDPAHINSIVMLSDGIETCGGDPCGLVEELKAEGINFTIHVIGLQVDDPTRDQLECIARAGGGTYHDANSEQDLAEALGAVQEDVTEDEVVVPFGVDTPTPAPPTDTPLPPTDTPLPPTDPPPPSPTTTKVPPTQAPAPAASGKIAYDDGNNIWVMNADGSGRKQLTNDPSVEVEPSWSPDGSRVAFVCKGGGSYGICFVNADGSGHAQIFTSSNFSMTPSWSPDGSQIAFEGLNSVYVVAVGGGSPRKVADCLSPAWAPDGRRLACATWGQNAGLAVMDVTAGSLQVIWTEGDAIRPDWSPDGKSIAFESLKFQTRSTARGIVVVQAGGGGVRRVTTDECDNISPTWSPDGHYIAFEQGAHCGKAGIWIVNADGSGARYLGSGSHPDW